MSTTVRSRVLAVPELDRPRRARPDLRVVDPDELSPAARRRRARILCTLVAVVVVGSLFGVTAMHTVLVADQGELDVLDRRVAEQEARYERLRLEVAELESPDRIVREATERLGMVPAADVVYLTPSPELAEEVLGADRPAADQGGG
ncbi:MAG TPA: septum formation initiator family protein [Acidimicrobiales bacterium]|jgi:cell division protein FtsL